MHARPDHHLSASHRPIQIHLKCVLRILYLYYKWSSLHVDHVRINSWGIHTLHKPSGHCRNTTWVSCIARDTKLPVRDTFQLDVVYISFIGGGCLSAQVAEACPPICYHNIHRLSLSCSLSEIVSPMNIVILKLLLICSHEGYNRSTIRQVKITTVIERPRYLLEGNFGHSAYTALCFFQ